MLEHVDDDPDDEMHGKSAAVVARRRERARCAAILQSSVGRRNLPLARTLAFETELSASAALAWLRQCEISGGNAHPRAGYQ